MKIIFKRTQVAKTVKAGFMKTNTNIEFVLNCVVQITNEENELFKKYDLFDQPILNKLDNTSYHIDDFVKGVTLEHWRLATLQENEIEIHKTLSKLKDYMTAAEEYKGEKIYEL